MIRYRHTVASTDDSRERTCAAAKYTPSCRAYVQDLIRISHVKITNDHCNERVSYYYIGLSVSPLDNPPLSYIIYLVRLHFSFTSLGAAAVRA